VTIFLPDVRSLQPTRVEWDNIRQEYRLLLDRILNNKTDPEETEKIDTNAKPPVQDSTAPSTTEDAAEKMDETPAAQPSAEESTAVDQQATADVEIVAETTSVDEPVADDKNKALLFFYFQLFYLFLKQTFFTFSSYSTSLSLS
jgi:hypothetical protein